MNIVQITPGAGGMYCGNCFRDNTLVRELRARGHATTMLPLYLPLTLEEPDQTTDSPIFFSGINVYLEQRSDWYRKSPRWVRRLFTGRRLLAWAGQAAKTRASDAGEITVSMLRGEAGRQAQELEELVGWLKKQPKPDVICLSNVLLLGMAGRLRQELGRPVVCMMQGEDVFLDHLPGEYRQAAWELLAQKTADATLLVAPSKYFGETMGKRLGISRDKLRIVYNGIAVDGFTPASKAPEPPVLGFFARMCPEKGLDILVEAFLILKQNFRPIKLKIGGGCGPGDEPFVRQLKRRLNAAGVGADCDFFPNPDRAAKQEFLRGVTVLSVPAVYGEAFGLYLLEAWASGVPVVQPRSGAFPELIDRTGGGLLCENQDPKSLAAAAGQLLSDPARARSMGAKAREVVLREFTASTMAGEMLKVFSDALRI